MRGREYPVLVVNNGYVSKNQKICKGFYGELNMRHVAETKTGLSYARNRALKECNTKYLVFLDDDAKPDPRWIDAIEAGIEKWSPDFFGGPYRPFYRGEKPDWFPEGYGSQYTGRGERLLKAGEHVSGGNMGWRTSLLRSLGGFPTELGMKGENLGIGEETYLVNYVHRHMPERKGVFLPNMSMKHLVSEEKMDVWYVAKRAWQYGWKLPLIQPKRERPTWWETFKETAVFPKLLIRLLLRNREKYPDWRTYAIHALSRSMVVLGEALSPYEGGDLEKVGSEGEALSARF
jgi:glycosyltransferase involved in cell wall biosynthesis